MSKSVHKWTNNQNEKKQIERRVDTQCEPWIRNPAQSFSKYSNACSNTLGSIQTHGDKQTNKQKQTSKQASKHYWHRCSHSLLICTPSLKQITISGLTLYLSDKFCQISTKLKGKHNFNCNKNSQIYTHHYISIFLAGFINPSLDYLHPPLLPTPVAPLWHPLTSARHRSSQGCEPCPWQVFKWIIFLLLINDSWTVFNTVLVLSYLFRNINLCSSEAFNQHQCQSLILSSLSVELLAHGIFLMCQLQRNSSLTVACRGHGASV